MISVYEPRYKLTIVRILLACILIFHAINLIIFLEKDTLFFSINHACNYLRTLDWFSLFDVEAPTESIVKIFKRILYTQSEMSQPHIHEIPSVFLYFIFGPSEDISVLPNILYLAILIYSVYGIGKKLYDRYTGLLAAFLVSMFPGIFAQTRVLFASLPQTALISLSIYFLLSSDDFKHRKYSILFGLTSGLSGWMRWDSYIFLIAPTIFVICSTFFRNSHPEKRSKINCGLSLGVSFLLLLSWFGQNFKFVFNFYKPLVASNFYTKEAWYKSLDFYSYVGYLFKAQLFKFFSIVFFLCLVYFLFTFKHKRKWLLLLWILIPYLFYTLYYAVSHLSCAYYTVPYLPAMALIIGGSVYHMNTRIGSNLIKSFLILLVIVFSLAQYYSLTYFNRQLFGNRQVFFADFAGAFGKISCMKERYEDTFKELHSYLRSISNDSGYKKKVVFLGSDFSLEQRLAWKVEIAQKIGSLKIITFHPLNNIMAFFPPKDREYYYKVFYEADIILDVDKPVEPGFNSVVRNQDLYKAIPMIKKIFGEVKYRFEVVKKIELPNSDKLLIYKKKAVFNGQGI